MDAAGARTTLHTFFFFLVPSISGDGTPLGNLIEGGDGIVYGTSYNRHDPPIPQGRIFRISREGVYSTVASAHSLEAGVIQASDGRLYGVFEGTVVDPYGPYVWVCLQSGSQRCDHSSSSVQWR